MTRAVLSGTSVPEPSTLRELLYDVMRFFWIITSSQSYVEHLAKQAATAGDTTPIEEHYRARFARHLDRKFWRAFIVVALGGALAAGLNRIYPLAAAPATLLQLFGAGLGLIAAVGIPKPDAWKPPAAERAAAAGTDLLLFVAFAAGAYGTFGTLNGG